MQQDQFLDVIDRDEAWRRFSAHLKLQPVGVEEVPLSAAWGRVLAETQFSPVNVPSFDRADYDGFALLATDTHGATESAPKTLRLLPDAIRTAVQPTCSITPGTAVPIATGAMLPRGADAVMMIEDTDTLDDRLEIRRGLAAGFGVTFAGTDISAGEMVLPRGEQLTSRDTGVLAAVGIDRVPVWRKPRVAVISTGDEVIPPGEPMRPGLVYDSNARIVADTVRELNAIPIDFGIAIDDEQQLATRLHEALAEADMVVLSGGTSKGEGDLSYRVVSRLGDPGIVVHGVALKPGKPLCLAVTDHKPVVILPGFPTSAIFTFHEFVAPILLRMGGLPKQHREQVKATLTVPINSVVGRTEFNLVGLVPERTAHDDSSPSSPTSKTSHPQWDATSTQQGERQARSYHALPMGKGSGSVTTFSRADGFFVIPRSQERVEAGTNINVQLLGRDLRIADLNIVGSHCVGLDELVAELQSAGWQLKTQAVGSTGGLNAVRKGQADVAGIHLLDEASDEYNLPFLDSNLCLIRGYRRRQGILTRRDDPRLFGTELESLTAQILAEDSCLMVNRNAGSGTRLLIDRLLQGKQPQGYSLQARNHHAVAAAILQGRADWGVAIETVARDPGLRFVPLRDECYDFAVQIARLDDAAVNAFAGCLRSPNMQAKLAAMGFATVNSGKIVQP